MDHILIFTYILPSKPAFLKGHYLTLCKCSPSDDESAGLLCILGFPLTWVHLHASFHYLFLQPLLPLKTLSLCSFKWMALGELFVLPLICQCQPTNTLVGVTEAANLAHGMCVL